MGAPHVYSILALGYSPAAGGLVMLSPSLDKFADELMASGLTAE
jgi:hypothetical protein